MIIQAELRRKQSEYEGEACVVDKVIELPAQRFQQFSRALLADYDFIAENKNAIRHDDAARHCLLILDAEGTDGILVDPQGYNYARYSAFVPNARSLLTPDMATDRSYLSPAEPWRDENRDEMLRMTLRVDGKPDYTLVLPADEDYLSAVKAYNPEDIHINFFGGMEIISSKGTLTGEDIKADQCYLLLAYLILNHKKNFTVDTLAEIICPYDELDSPYKVVNNIVYRLRRTLSVIGLDKLVIGKNGTFQINPNFNIHTDFDRFEDACIQLKTEENPDMRHSLYHSAVDMYKGQLRNSSSRQMKNAQISPSFRKRRKRKRCCAGSVVHRHLSEWNKVLPTCSTVSQITRTAYSISAVPRQPHILKRRRR